MFQCNRATVIGNVFSNDYEKWYSCFQSFTFKVNYRCMHEKIVQKERFCIKCLSYNSSIHFLKSCTCISYLHHEYMGFSLSILFMKVIKFSYGFFCSYVDVTIKHKFYRRLQGNVFVILIWLSLCHGINPHLVLDPDSQLVSADKNLHTYS